VISIKLTNASKHLHGLREQPSLQSSCAISVRIYLCLVGLLGWSGAAWFHSVSGSTRLRISSKGGLSSVVKWASAYAKRNKFLVWQTAFPSCLPSVCPCLRGLAWYKVTLHTTLGHLVRQLQSISTAVAGVCSDKSCLYWVHL
jgi:hypothetical protein